MYDVERGHSGGLVIMSDKFFFTRHGRRLLLKHFGT